MDDGGQLLKALHVLMLKILTETTLGHFLYPREYCLLRNSTTNTSLLRGIGVEWVLLRFHRSSRKHCLQNNNNKAAQQRTRPSKCKPIATNLCWSLSLARGKE